MRIVLVTDPPWAQTANARQMAELAHRLQDDLHTVYWMPTWGFSDGGRIDWETIEMLPGDDHFGNDIIKHHVHMTAANLVITRGWAEQFTEFGGSDFAWWAWHPGPIVRKVLRKSNRILAVSQDECDELETVSGVVPFLVPRGVSQVFTQRLKDPTAVATFRRNHDVPEDVFLLSAIGPQDPHWKRMLDAFKLFHERHENTLLYLHTDVMRPLDLLLYCKAIGLSRDTLRVPHGYDFHRGYYDATIAAMYHATDVHLVPGMATQPIIEAMACGTPVLTTDRPEAREIMSVDDLGALVPPVTTHERQPLLDVEAWVTELENAYKMTDSERTNHGACCQMIVREHHWDKVYEGCWRPMLAVFEKEEKERLDRTPLEGAQPDGKRATAFLEDLGFVESCGCEVVRKTDIGGNTQDERAKNTEVRSWGQHPNVIHILREGEDQFGHYYFDTPKLAPLKDIFEFTKEQGDKILADIRAGLAFMHEHGAAHCDINPRNILLTDTHKVDDKWVMGPDMQAVIFDFDYIQTGLDSQIAWLCDYDPLHILAMPYAVPVMASGIATRGFHRVVTHIRNLDFEHSWATSHADMPYQQIEGVGERDCDHRWAILQPDVKGKRVLDLGCNLGYFAGRALREGAASVLAIDRDGAIVEAAKKLHPALDGNCVQMDLDKTLPGGEYDTCFCLSIWQHMRDGKRPLLEMLKRIPVTYWEDANLTQPDLEHLGFNVERLARSERGRNLFKLEPKELVHG